MLLGVDDRVHPERLELPPLGWRLADGSEPALDVVAAVVFALSGVAALMIGLSGLAIGDRVQSLFLVASPVAFAASAIVGSHPWTVWVRIVAAACAAASWWWLLHAASPGEPLAVVTFVGLAAASAWCGLAFVARPELWRARPRAEGGSPDRSGALFWIEEV
jgi:hypothetical protein